MLLVRSLILHIRPNGIAPTSSTEVLGNMLFGWPLDSPQYHQPTPRTATSAGLLPMTRSNALVGRLIPALESVVRSQMSSGAHCYEGTPYYEPISEGSTSACGHRSSSCFSEPAAGGPTPNDFFQYSCAPGGSVCMRARNAVTFQMSCSLSALFQAGMPV